MDPWTAGQTSRKAARSTPQQKRPPRRAWREHGESLLKLALKPKPRADSLWTIPTQIASRSPTETAARDPSQDSGEQCAPAPREDSDSLWSIPAAPRSRL